MRARAAIGAARALPVVAALALLTWQRPAWAWFESSPVGARALALGESFVSVADDASALYWNPAGLVQLPRHEAMLSYDQPLDLEGLHSGFAGVVGHTTRLSLGLGWQHAGLDGTSSEDLIYLSMAHTAVRRSLGAFVSAGGTLKLAHVGLDTDGFEAVPGLRAGATGWCGDLGLLLAPIPNVTAGAIVRNLGQPHFDLIEGGARTTLASEIEWGVSLRWREDAWLHMARVKHPRGDALTRLGAEVRIAGVLALRAGYGRDVVTGGVGLAWRRWTLDSAFQAHDLLGVTYRVGLRCGFGRKRTAVGGAYDEF